MSAEPAISPMALALDMKSLMLGLRGGAEAGTPVSDVETFEAALAKANRSVGFKIYSGAPHDFHADYRASYREEAAEDAWSRMRAWSRQHEVLG